jgi:phosphatidylserine/phosphatidylglycerophosphate/cardiolipin synthase-like enzyme
LSTQSAIPTPTKPHQDTQDVAYVCSSHLSPNVALYYSGYEDTAGGVHSKLIIVDDEIAIVSSMNFTSHSESYNYETGIVTTDKAVVDSAKESIIGIRDENETESANELHQR